MSWLPPSDESYFWRGVLGIALLAFALGGFVVWCLMRSGGVR